MNFSTYLPISQCLWQPKPGSHGQLGKRFAGWISMFLMAFLRITAQNLLHWYPFMWFLYCATTPCIDPSHVDQCNVLWNSKQMLPTSDTLKTTSQKASRLFKATDKRWPKIPCHEFSVSNSQHWKASFGVKEERDNHPVWAYDSPSWN